MKKSEEFKSFVILPELSIFIRIIITILLIIIAVFVQFYFDKNIPGFVILSLTSIFNIVRNVKYEANPSFKKEWKQVTEEEYKKFVKRMEKLKKLRGIGFSGKFTLIFIIVFIIIFLGPFITKVFLLNKNLTTLIIDFFILFLPVFLSGNKIMKIKYEEDAYIKVKNLLFLMQVPELKIKKFELVPYFEISNVKNRGKLPVDAKAMLRAKDAPSGVIGIQFQVSINNVQSKKYPYFYAVIIAKKEFNLPEKFKKFVSGDSIKFEFSEEKDVDVLVIRQKTTKTSGYYTNEDVIRKIILTSLEIFENISRVS